MGDRSSPRSPLLLVVLGVVAIAVVALCTYAVTRDEDPPAAPPTDSAFRVTVIGDDYSSGRGNTVVWPDLLARSTGWQVDNASSIGAGYVSPGAKGTFQTEAGTAIDPNTDAVVIFGGLNDVGRPAALITQRASDLIGFVARSSPGTRIVVIGPAWHELPTPAAVSTINTAVESAAQAMRVPFLDVAGESWLVGRGLIQSDDIHPTDSGQRVLADRLGQLLRRTGVLQ